MSIVLAELTDEQIQATLAGEVVKGPRQFRGRPLADYSHGLRATVLKIVRPDDAIHFHDLALLYVLTQAYGETNEERIKRRRALLSETDDVSGFRAKISVEFMDDLSDAEAAEARRLADEILTPADQARVTVVADLKKKDGDESAEPSPTTTPS